MNRKVLILIIIVLAIVAFIIFNGFKPLKQEGSIPDKPKFLCDNTKAICAVPNNKQIPKGVCVPGGECT